VDLGLSRTAETAIEFDRIAKGTESSQGNSETKRSRIQEVRFADTGDGAKQTLKFTAHVSEVVKKDTAKGARRGSKLADDTTGDRGTSDPLP
jgi:hypothetical protein